MPKDSRNTRRLRRAVLVLQDAGVAAGQATYARLSVNGGEERLRLVLDLPDDDLWNEDEYDGSGITYKAEAEGDDAYRGDDAAEYLEAFGVEYDDAGLSQDEEYAPLIALLAEYLDVESFATYLAAQELISNTDDIDGPGNNASLRYDAATGLFSVIAWDHNLAYGVSNGGDGGTRTGGPAAEGRADESRNGAAAGRGGDNPLVTRFLADDGFVTLCETALDDLTASISDSGAAQGHLDSLVATLSAGACDLVSVETIDAEASDIAAHLSADDGCPGSPAGDRLRLLLADAPLPGLGARRELLAHERVPS